MAGNRWFFWGAAILAWLFSPAFAAETLQIARDLPAEAGQAARHGAPLVVLYSRRDCKFCETVRRDYLLPLQRDPRWRQHLVIRQINQDSPQPLVDFKGQTTNHAAFAQASKVKMVPVVAFYGPQGQTLAEPIVGARLPDFYPSYLDTALNQASQALKTLEK